MWGRPFVAALLAAACAAGGCAYSVSGVLPSHLKTLAVDYLKIVGRFITGLLDDPLDHAAVRGFRDGETIGADRDDIAGLERVIELRNGPPVDRDCLEFQPRAHLLFLFLRPRGEKKRKKFRRFLNGGRLRHGDLRPGSRACT